MERAFFLRHLPGVKPGVCMGMKENIQIFQ
jgi:hypothetical protein